jgi:pyridoxamine 5'-phosphate oxidase
MASDGSHVPPEDLESLLADCWSRLQSAAADRRDPFHIMGLSTVGQDGRPRARSVVLRAVEPEARLIVFHCDRRSPKVEELQRDPRLALLFYDKPGGLQLRIEAEAEIHLESPRAEEAWRKSHRFARRCYLQEEGPSSPASGPTSGLPPAFETREPEEAELDPARENFCLVACRVERLDRFSLAHDGHRRAAWRWRDEGAVESTWLVP